MDIDGDVEYVVREDIGTEHCYGIDVLDKNPALLSQSLSIKLCFSTSCFLKEFMIICTWIFPECSSPSA